MTFTLLIRGGTVIDTDPDHPMCGPADVLVTGGRIAAVTPRPSEAVTPGAGSGAAAPAEPALPHQTTAPATTGSGRSHSDSTGYAVIDAKGMIVSPGFVDTHRHTWQAGIRAIAPDATFGGYLTRVLGELAPRHRPEDVYAANLAGALECLDAGITTLVDWSHILLTPGHADAAVAALRASGIRAVFGFCGGPRDPTGLLVEGRRVHRDHFAAADPLLSMAVAALGPEIVDEEGALSEWLLARELDLPVTVHMGGNGADSAERGLAFLDRHGLLRPRTTYVHANHYTDEALQRIAASGGTISVSPVIEPALGFGMPVTGRARAAGLPTGLGADAVTSGPGDMFSLMRAAYTVECARAGGAGTGLTTRDALRMATIDGARVAGLGDVTGSLRPGKRADLVLLRTDTIGMAPAHDPIGAVVLSADTAAVDTVLVGGRIVKRGGRLLHHDLAEVTAALGRSAAHVAGRNASPSPSGR